MAIDQSHIGRTLDPIALDIERGRLIAFAKATGQADPTYSDLDAAKGAGHLDLPVPPTFLFAIELEAADPFAWATEMGIDLRFVLHGEQRFDYKRVAYAGERLTAAPRIEDIYSKSGGALDFIVKRTAVTDEQGQLVADLSTVVVVRNTEVSR